MDSSGRSSASDLRLLMKKHSMLKSGSSEVIAQTKLTGKEKLLLLRQQQQQQQTHNSASKKQSTTKYDATTTTGSSGRHSSTSQQLSKASDRPSDLPPHFFDHGNGDNNSIVAQSAIDSTSKFNDDKYKKKNISYSATTASNHNQTTVTPMNNIDDVHHQSTTLPIHSISVTVPPKKDEPSKNNAVLPMGFFDNPIEDLNAHGMTFADYRNKVDKEEKQELDQFLSEVKAIEPTNDELDRIESEEALMNEYEDEAKQISYYAKLMMLQSQLSISSHNNNSEGKSHVGSSSIGIGGTSYGAVETNQLLHTILRETTMLTAEAIIDGDVVADSYSEPGNIHVSSSSGSSSSGSSSSGSMRTSEGREVEEILYDKLLVRLSKKRRIVQNRDAFQLCKRGNIDVGRSSSSNRGSSSSSSSSNSDARLKQIQVNSSSRSTQQNCEAEDSNDDVGDDNYDDDYDDDDDDDDDSVVEYTPLNFLS